MTTGLDYNGFVNQIATYAVVDPTDENFLEILPQAITAAENRICRELDFLFTSVPNTSFYFTVGSRQVNIPGGTFVVPEQFNVIYPATAMGPDNGTRIPLIATTREFLDATCGNSTNVGLPKYFAPIGGVKADGALSIIVGPYPDAAYNLEIIGTIRPDSLSPTNPQTFISQYLPDLMIPAAMVWISAYQRNFSSAAANDPQMPVTWETMYKTAMAGAAIEEFRKKFEAAAWSSKISSPTSTPTR